MHDAKITVVTTVRLVGYGFQLFKSENRKYLIYMAEYMVDELGMNFHTVDFKPQMDGSQTYFIPTFS
jgi:hypothetical protein